jgi:hypothetical protein
MVGLCQSQRHHSCLIIVRISSSGESGKGKMYSRIRKAFSPDFLSQGLKEGLVVSLKRVRGLLTGLMKGGHAVFITSGDQVYRSWVCAEHLQHTHSGICTCISRTDYSKPPKSVPPLTSSPSIRQSGSDLRPATPTLTHAPSIIISPH